MPIASTRRQILCYQNHLADGSTVYQWRSDDWEFYSPVLHSEQEAREWPDKFGLFTQAEKPGIWAAYYESRINPS